MHEALRAGLLEPPEWTHEESVTTQVRVAALPGCGVGTLTPALAPAFTLSLATQAIVDRLRAAVVEDEGARKEAEAQ